jgi:hypothetical protein
MTMPLTIINRITDRLNPLKSSRGMEKNYMNLSINPSESSRELKKNYMTLPVKITDKITDGT